MDRDQQSNKRKQLTRDIDTEKSSTSSIFTPKDEEALFECNLCDQRFPSKGKRSNHIKNDHCFKCDICGRIGLQTRAALASHMMTVHGVTETKTCPECSVKFVMDQHNSTDKYVKHLLNHQNETSKVLLFSCHQCKRVRHYLTDQELQEHVAIFHYNAEVRRRNESAEAASSKRMKLEQN